MTRPRPLYWIGLAAVAGAGLLSGCYYYPYGYNPWGYPYPYASGWGYPYAAGPAYAPAPAAMPPYPQQPVPPTAQQQPVPPIALQPTPGAPQPLDEPVERAPLPPQPQ